MRLTCAIVLVIGIALPAIAEEDRGWSFSGSFNGSTNSDGAVLKATPILGYRFNNHVQTYSGLPFYFVNLSSTATSSTGGFTSGIGNAFAGLRFNVYNDTVDYSSTVELTAPTGDKSRGFSTGRVTADWTNRFSHRFDSFTPFGSVGVANTISDTNFFVRPFTSLGLVTHFEGGGSFDLSSAVRVGGSAYAVRAAGNQTIISKVIKRQSSSTATTGPTTVNVGGTTVSVPGVKGKGDANRVFETQTQTVVPAEVANDHGVSTWFGVSPGHDVDFQIGYSRSMHYDFNTVFFGVAFHVGK